MGIWYCTREDVARMLDVRESAHANALIDSAIEAACRAIDGRMARRFWPELGTVKKDWPAANWGAPSYRLWLDADEMISLTSLTAGGITIDSSNYNLEPVNSGPPFNRLELRTDASATFSGGSTSQQAVVLTGWRGYRDDQASVGTNVGSLSDSATSMVCSDSSLIGVGTLLVCGSERMVVTERGWTSSGQTLQSSVTAEKSAVSLAVTTGSAFRAGELLLLDSERVEVVDVAGNTLTVQRAVQGSVLAAHTNPTIYVRRALTVTRGAVGTTAAAHADAVTLYAWQPHGLLRRLAAAEAAWMRQNDLAGWSGSVGTGESESRISAGQLKALRDEAFIALARKARHRAV